MQSASGECPHCGRPGEVGAACPERGCARWRSHFIPTEHIARTEHQLPDPLVGQKLGQNLVAGLIGTGGAGRVYLGLQLPLLMKVAVKLLNTEHFPEAMAALLTEKFDAEARALAELSHPNVVRLHEYGWVADRPYLVMEYIDNGIELSEDVETRAAEGSRYSADELRDILRQLLAGLGAAHERGIIHRDVKPDNIMLQEVVGYARHLRLLDFGLAKFVEHGRKTKHVAGTPAYMAPEQYTDKEMGWWTDLYAVAIIAFELMTGRTPFPGATVDEIYRRKLDQGYDPCERSGIKLTPGARDFFRRAFAPPPLYRHRDETEFQMRLFAAIDEMEAGPDKPLGQISLARLYEPTFVGPNARPEPTPNARTESDQAFRRWMEREAIRIETEAAILEQE